MLVLALLFSSCSLPQGSSDLTGLPEPSGPQLMNLTVETDTSRNQGVYVNEKGVKIDISSVEEADGSVVNCVEAVDIITLQEAEFASKSFGDSTVVKAIVIGKRDDDRPGVWEIHSDDSIHPLHNKDDSRESSLLSESEDRNGGIRGLFGWEYKVVDVATDGNGGIIIVGEAVNESGFQIGRWVIEPDTKVGVYWTLGKLRYGRYCLISQARVIGTPAERSFRRGPTDHVPRRPNYHRLNWWVWHMLNRLRLFFLNWYESYLTEVYGVSYDPEKDVYVVEGKYQDGQPAIATIGKNYQITITPMQGPGNGGVYERIVIESFHPIGPLWSATDTKLTLYDADGVQLAYNNQVGAYDLIDYLDGLAPGTYYIKVSLAAGGAGPYAIRVLSLGLNDPLPVYDLPGVINERDSPYEQDDATPWSDPANANPAVIGIGETLNRALSSDQDVDVDWMVITLP